MDLRSYIEERSIPEPNTGCWIWLLSLGSHGYGQGTSPATRVTVAHRLSYEAFIGPIPPGALVQHSCDHHWCVAPHHLSLGTDKTNSDDKHRRGRANLASRRFGPHPGRKLTAEQVRDIRAATGRLRDIAARHGISSRAVWAVKRRLHYREVN